MRRETERRETARRETERRERGERERREREGGIVNERESAFNDQQQKFLTNGGSNERNGLS